MGRRLSGSAVIAVLASILGAACTDSDLYSSLGGEPLLPDRVALSGKICTEDTSSSNFPVKILFVVDQSNDMFIADPGGLRFKQPPQAPPGSIGSIRARFGSLPHVHLGFIGFAQFPQSLPPDANGFLRPTDPEVDSAIIQMAIPRAQQRDLRAALNAAEGFILNDINLSPPGEILRTRYIVSVLMAGPPDPSVSIDAIAEQVQRMSAAIYERGTLEFRVNTNMLHYGPRSIDLAPSNNFNCYAEDPADPPCACPGGLTEYCSVYCGVTGAAIDWDQRLDTTRRILRAVAFAAGGVFREYNCPPDIDFNVEVASSSVDLVKKDIIAFNRNAYLGPDGHLIDSDADGLPDIHELSATPPTDPTLWDTDGDGIGDRVEFRMVPAQDPTDPFDRPPSCDDPAFGIPDRDFDLLNDCEEGLLQSSATIPDTDGDGIPDLPEFLGGTVPTSAEDRLLDFDSDGIPNAQEVLEHTNPRSNDALLRGSEGYRNNVVSLGRQVVPEMENPPELLGITFRRGSPLVVPGPVWLRWDPCTQMLEWSDARYPAGIQPFVPTPVHIPGTGLYTLTATAANGQQIWADFFVVLQQMPPCTGDPPIQVKPLLTAPERECYDLRITNIRLVETQPATTPGGLAPAGQNSILVYFTQSPQSRLASPGIAKVAEVKVIFRCTDPDQIQSCARSTPDIVDLTDGDFASAF